MNNSYFFLHGLESSGQGTKGRFFTENFPFVQCPDFTGSLESRVLQLDKICSGSLGLTFIGSSFGGLMASCYAIRHPLRVKSLYLLAPALNFEDFVPPPEKIAVQTFILLGEFDEVTPIDPVLALAESTFQDLTVNIVPDDHFLHKSFTKLDWKSFLR